MNHITFQKKINFNKLIILDCLPENEYQTARRLHENLSDKGFGSGISLLKVQDAQSFRNILKNIKDFFIPELKIGLRPIIHIEAHGNPISMVLPDKSIIHWNELADELGIINRLMNNELIAFIGTCHGYNFIHKNHTIKKFTPVYFCIAPFDAIPAGDIENATHTFYNSLFSTGDLTSSANLLDLSKFHTYNSDYMFHRAFHEAMQRHNRGKALKNRREELITLAIKELGHKWNEMTPKDKKEYLFNARKVLNVFLQSKEALREQFIKFSTCYMGYVNEDVFEEIWRHMQDNKQGRIY
ncbi:hypothetical protein UDZ25_20195 [Serratia marcescens]|uniref:hypothetical protein n=1 Tax=Serratia TaxID=613 RepID=UPI0039C0009E